METRSTLRTFIRGFLLTLNATNLKCPIKWTVYFIFTSTDFSLNIFGLLWDGGKKNSMRRWLHFQKRDQSVWVQFRQARNIKALLSWTQAIASRMTHRTACLTSLPPTERFFYSEYYKSSWCGTRKAEPSGIWSWRTANYYSESTYPSNP